MVKLPVLNLCCEHVMLWENKDQQLLFYPGYVDFVTPFKGCTYLKGYPHLRQCLIGAGQWALVLASCPHLWLHRTERCLCICISLHSLLWECAQLYSQRPLKRTEKRLSHLCFVLSKGTPILEMGEVPEVRPAPLKAFNGISCRYAIKIGDVNTPFRPVWFWAKHLWLFYRNV